MEENKISVLGINIPLIPLSKSELKGLNVDMLLRFHYYAAMFNNEQICVIRPKNKDVSLTPSRYKKALMQVENIVRYPVVVWLDALSYIERERFIKQKVYFIISDKYAFLPYLIVNTKVKAANKSNKKLLPVAQYVLIYYLLSSNDKNKFTIKELSKILPYNYLSISRAIISIEQLQLCSIEKDNNKTKIITFNKDKRMLWNRAKGYMFSPVKKNIYSDIKPDGTFRIGGVNALSHYSHLNSEKYGTLAIWDKDFVPSQDIYNEIEGNYKIEIWKYPVTMPFLSKNKVVDKLSLFLSLKDEHDARIEKELNILIENIIW